MSELGRLTLGALIAITACGGSDKPTDGAAASAHSIRLRLTAVDGGEIDLATYRGRVVVLHLFDTDSTAAALDAEQLSDLTRRRRDHTRVIGICLDREGYPMAAAWRKALNVPYMIALGNDAMRTGGSPLGKLKIVPTTIVLDRSGTVVARVDRPLQPDELETLVAPLLE